MKNCIIEIEWNLFNFVSIWLEKGNFKQPDSVILNKQINILANIRYTSDKTDNSTGSRLIWHSQKLACTYTNAPKLSTMTPVHAYYQTLTQGCCFFQFSSIIKLTRYCSICMFLSTSWKPGISELVLWLVRIEIFELMGDLW